MSAELEKKYLNDTETFHSNQFSDAWSEVRTAHENLDQVSEQKRQFEKALSTQTELFSELESVLREQMNITSEENNTLKSQKAALEKKLQERDQHVQNAERLSFHHQVVKKREIKIEQYAENLRRSQLGVRNLIENIVSDLALAIQMHPTNDLLKITEFELEKAEIEMKKTPTSSANRKPLEMVFEDLIHQRNFLRSVREASIKEMKTRIENLKKTINDSSLEELPPMPPLCSP